MSSLLDNSVVSSCIWGATLLGIDIILYGWLIPIIVILFDGWLLTSLNVDCGPVWEIILTCAVVFLLLNYLFRGNQESEFWKRYFSEETHFNRVLQVRDAVNVVVLIYSIYSLCTVINSMINDGVMKSKHLHDAISYVALRPVVSDSFLERHFVVCPVLQKTVSEQPQVLSDDAHQATISDTPTEHWLNVLLYWFDQLEWVDWIKSLEARSSNHDEKILAALAAQETLECQKQERIKNSYIHGAMFLLTMTQISATLSKFIYFNALYAYLRAMRIFIRINDFEERVKRDENENFNGDISMRR